MRNLKNETNKKKDNSDNSVIKLEFLSMHTYRTDWALSRIDDSVIVIFPGRVLRISSDGDD